METFNTIIFKKKENKTLESIFFQYDYWEEYCPNKIYPIKYYERKYKNKINTYVNVLCSLELEDSTQKYYILSERYVNENSHLVKFCPCIKCNLSFINPVKYLWCECCTGCIKSGQNFASKEIVEKAKDYYNKGKKPFLNREKIIETVIISSGILYLIVPMLLF